MFLCAKGTTQYSLGQRPRKERHTLFFVLKGQHNRRSIVLSLQDKYFLPVISWDVVPCCFVLRLQRIITASTKIVRRQQPALIAAFETADR